MAKTSMSTSQATRRLGGHPTRRPSHMEAIHPTCSSIPHGGHPTCSSIPRTSATSSRYHQTFMTDRTLPPSTTDLGNAFESGRAAWRASCDCKHPYWASWPDPRLLGLGHSSLPEEEPRPAPLPTGSTGEAVPRGGSTERPASGGHVGWLPPLPQGRH